MKKITLFFLLVLSQTIFAATNITETEKLVATCKVWGFLKYYHPKVANGELNWDNKLLDILPKIEKAQTKEEFSLVLENWIDDLGEVKQISPIVLLKDVEFFDKNFDLSWFNNKLFSKKLSKKLKFIEENRFQTDEEIGPGYNPFKNGNYSNLEYDNKNSRILMLFMYWNLIEYYFPYKYMMNQKWDLTLQKTLPMILNAQNEDDFYNVIRKMSAKLDDSHVEFASYKQNKLDESDNRRYFPAKCKIIDNKIVVTEILADSLAQAEDLKIGDVITKINNKTVTELISEYRDLFSASNEPVLLDKVLRKILNSYSDNVNVEFLKEGKYTTKAMKWLNYHDSHRNEFKKGSKKKKERFKVLDNNIGYVNMGLLQVANVPDMIETLKFTKAIVFDMRNYPNGTYREISNFLNPHQEKFAIYTYPDFSYPGRFKWQNGTMCGSENKDHYTGKVIVLLNEESISQSEWTAMCFQTAGNTTIIGSQTAGADGNVTELDFREFHTRYSGIGVYYPDKRETQRIGIVPDIEVKPTIKGIQEGKDEVLDRALTFIETGK